MVMGNNLTVVVQIGNSDDKPTQLEWSSYVKDVREMYNQVSVALTIEWTEFV